MLGPIRFRYSLIHIILDTLVFCNSFFRVAGRVVCVQPRTGPGVDLDGMLMGVSEQIDYEPREAEYGFSMAQIPTD